jgi:hypothetical protein
MPSGQGRMPMQCRQINDIFGGRYNVMVRRFGDRLDCLGSD